jgi:hypothetical protein
VGSRFTWNNGQSDSKFIKERLDRAVANKEWCQMFEEVEVQILAARTSYHKPLLVVGGDTHYASRSHKRGFKFEARWWLDEEYNNVVQSAWDSAGGGINALENVQQKLASCQADLTSWSCRKFGDTKKKVKEKTKHYNAVRGLQTEMKSSN